MSSRSYRLKSLMGGSNYQEIVEGTPAVETRKRIIQSYDDRITRTYSRIRFHIINSHFLEQIEQYLPESGQVLDIGCGFGLFANYFAARSPERTVHGIDIDEKRIIQAEVTAKRLGLENAHFYVGDARRCEFDQQFDAVVVLDLLHHVGYETADRLIDAVYRNLKPGGVFILKDVNVRPWWKLFFTYVLDKLMDPKRTVHYRDMGIWRQRAIEVGFDPVYTYHLNDYLPYPHILVLCHKTA
jgi:2-polyprenyl-3-methyl-5-hydroxy-6-metoxy-1,4-benzoquinol methylase